MSSVFPVYAHAEEDVSREGRMECYMLLTNVATGEVTKVELDESNTEITKNDEGILVQSEVSTENIIPEIQTRNTQTTTKPAQYGWEGSLKITYFDDGTVASLTAVNGTWKRVSGSYNMTSRNVTYGQVLGTNSNNGSKAFYENTVTVYPHFEHGKYGYNGNHFLGANMTGLVNGTRIEIVCNYYF